MPDSLIIDEIGWGEGVKAGSGAKACRQTLLVNDASVVLKREMGRKSSFHLAHRWKLIPQGFFFFFNDLDILQVQRFRYNSDNSVHQVPNLHGSRTSGHCLQLFHLDQAREAPNSQVLLLLFDTSCLGQKRVALAPSF